MDKLLPEQIFYLQHREKNLERRQLPWVRYYERLAYIYKKGSKRTETPPTFEKINISGLGGGTKPYPVRGDYEQRKYGVTKLREEMEDRMLRYADIRRKLAIKQTPLNVEHTIK